MKNISPLQSIRRHCLHSCMNGQAHMVRECDTGSCPLHAFRMGRLPRTGPRSPLRATRRHCLTCVAGRTEVRECTATAPFGGQPACSLWPFRMGLRPSTVERRIRTREYKARRETRGRVEKCKPGPESGCQLGVSTQSATPKGDAMRAKPRGVDKCCPGGPYAGLPVPDENLLTLFPGP